MLGNYIFLVFIFIFCSCAQKNSLSPYTYPYPSSKFVDFIEKGSLRSNGRGFRKFNYDGHYLNPESAYHIRNSNLNEQSRILVYCLAKLDVDQYDGEVAYEFSGLFDKPYGVKKVVIEAGKLLDEISIPNKNCYYSDDQIKKVRIWLSGRN